MGRIGALTHPYVFLTVCLLQLSACKIDSSFEFQGSGRKLVDPPPPPAPINTAPVAQNQSVTVNFNTAKVIVLLATDAELNPLTYYVLASPTKGALSGTAPNLTYTPNTGYSGNDSFTFKANDGSADSNIATVSITVETDPAKTVDTFPVNNTPPMDILFVMDNSQSMAGEQDSLASSFSSFIDAFNEKSIDYQIGVVSTDGRPITSSDWCGNAYDDFLHWLDPIDQRLKIPGGGSLLGHNENGKRFIKKSDFFNPSDVPRAFAKNIKLGAGGFPGEAGLLAATLALGPEKLKAGAWNEGFVRPKSMLSVIIVSDADENYGVGPTSQQPVSKNLTDQDTRIKNFLDTLNNIRPKQPDLLRLDLIVAGAPDCKGEQEPITYKKALEKFNDGRINKGTIIDICKGFADSLADLGNSLTAAVQRNFVLSRKPDSGSLVVKLDGGVDLSQNSSNGYTYEGTTNTVTLNGLNLETKKNFTVTIEYKAAP